MCRSRTEAFLMCYIVAHSAVALKSAGPQPGAVRRLRFTRQATQMPQPFFPFTPPFSSGTENCLSIFSRKVGPELYVQNG